MRRQTDHEVLATLHDALQAWKREELTDGAVCLILQHELEPSALTDAARERACDEIKRLMPEMARR